MPERDDRAGRAVSGVNWDLLEALSTRPHPLLNLDGQCPDCPRWTGEVLQEARNAHHLLDLMGVPHGEGYEQDLDARTHRAVMAYLDLDMRLGRIIAWHTRETGPAGTFGDYCNECGRRWPCDTFKFAAGAEDDD